MIETIIKTDFQMLKNKTEHCHKQANQNERCIYHYDYILKPTWELLTSRCKKTVLGGKNWFVVCCIGGGGKLTGESSQYV